MEFYGTKRGDTWHAPDDYNTGVGRAGDDKLYGGTQLDVLYGGDGADLLSGGDGDDRLYAEDIDMWTAGNDPRAVDHLSGGAGVDQLVFGFGDFADGGADYDFFTADLSAGGAGVTADLGRLIDGETVALGSGSLVNLEKLDRLVGTAFADSIHAERIDGDYPQGGAEFRLGAGSDKLWASGMENRIYAGSGNDEVRAGAGDDGVFGDAGDDKLHGGGDDDSLDGGDGKDALYGEEGRDSLTGGAGADKLYGGEGDDVIYAYSPDAPDGAVDTIDGGAGDDWVYASAEDRGTGGAGTDGIIIDASGAKKGVTIEVSSANTATFTDFEAYAAVTGSGKADHIVLSVAAVADPWNIDRLPEVHGAGGDDTVSVGDVADRAWGDDGNDHLSGNGGDDALDGGAGKDLLDGGAGNDRLAGDWNDSFIGGTGTDALAIDGSASEAVKLDFSKTSTIEGGEVSGIERVETLHLSELADSLTLGPARLTTLAGALPPVRPRATIFGEGGNDRITGGKGADQFDGGAGDDKLAGGKGDDWLVGGAGADRLDGGSGKDTAVYGGYGAVTVDLASGTATGEQGTDKLVSIENVVGSDGSDKLYGNDGDNVFYLNASSGDFYRDRIDGRGGIDTVSFALGYEGVTVDLSTGRSAGNALRLTGIENLVGSESADNFTGSSGANSLSGGDGDDTLKGGKGDDHLLGGSGDDLIVGGSGADRMEGGAGSDNYIVDSKADVIVEVDDGSWDRVTSSVSFTLGKYLEDLTLTAAATGHGNAGNNHLIGSSGNDKLYGEGGDDTINGGKGNDYLEGEGQLDGGDGNDTLRTSGGFNSNGGAGQDTLYATGTNVSLAGDIELVYLVNGGTVFGNYAAEHTIGALDKANSINGLEGDDVMEGGNLADWLSGGTGDDVATGNGGGDSFAFSGFSTTAVDRITDYSSSEGDKLDFTALESEALAHGISEISYRGTGAFTGHAGEARTELHDGYGLFMFDLDGDRGSDLTIRLDGVTASSTILYVL